jgi:hypothetical protein
MGAYDSHHIRAIFSCCYCSTMCTVCTMYVCTHCCLPTSAGALLLSLPMLYVIPLLVFPLINLLFLNFNSLFYYVIYMNIYFIAVVVS